jgi:hypothetical protein
MRWGTTARGWGLKRTYKGAYQQRYEDCEARSNVRLTLPRKTRWHFAADFFRDRTKHEHRRHHLCIANAHDALYFFI